ncbi:hypothetical protein AC579_7593 [Pseudocercospora musae]|uniref:Uncharacterized protein n=1 Tax=Pseudocercospora musae TaxID=113226 RepID=A0A139H3M2_9PEZI|nr:hypothetical protein AC579_7593 [Pseudocercospora musae]
MTNKRVRDGDDDIEEPCSTKRARCLDMRSVPPSPTDRINLDTFQHAQLDLDKADARLTEHRWLQQFMDEVRSEGESSMGDDEIARLADWNWDGRSAWRYDDSDDEVKDDQRDTPATQYDEQPGEFVKDMDQDVWLDHTARADGEHESTEANHPRLRGRKTQDGPSSNVEPAESRSKDSFARICAGRCSLAMLKEIAYLYR